MRSELEFKGRVEGDVHTKTFAGETAVETRLDYEGLFSVITTPLLVMDSSFKIVKANIAYMKATGMRENESVGRSVFEVFPSNPHDNHAKGEGELRTSLQKVVNNGVTDEMPITKYDIPKRDSSSGEFEERFWKPINTPLFDSKGKLTHILHRVEDVTDIVRAQNYNMKMEMGQHEITALRMAEDALRSSQFELQKIVDLTPVTIAVFKGPEHRYVITNREQERLVGKPVKGLTIREAYTEEERKNLENILDPIYETGQPFFGKELPYTFLGKDGMTRERWINLSFEAIPAMDGSISGILGVAQDVTDQVVARNELQAALDEQKQTELELKQAKEEAERANQLKSAFLSNMSHEIRTPLGAIIGFAELLKEDGDTSENDRKLYLDTIVRNGKALLEIINDILDLAKVESGMLEPEEISLDLHELLEETVDLFREKVKEKGIRLHLHILPNLPSRIQSDPTRLRQILINLIGNAVKFTEEGWVEIKVEGHLSTPSTCQVEIQVIDTGVGISAQSVEQLFQPFSQADSTHARRFGGTGLGLVLSRRLASALNGNVELKESRIGIGSTFTFSFNAKLEEKSWKSSPKLANASRGVPGILCNDCRILVVDDSADNILLAERILAKHGAKVVTASNGADALELARSDHFDLILLDIQMPFMDGYEALRLLRLDGYKGPIVALTAHAMSHEVEKILSAGFDSHVTKPMDQTVLIDTLEMLLSGADFRCSTSSSMPYDSEQSY